MRRGQHPHGPLPRHGQTTNYIEMSQLEKLKKEKDLRRISIVEYNNLGALTQLQLTISGWNE